MSSTILEALRRLQESDNANEIINLDYKKKDNIFLDKMWELVSPDYKIHWIDNSGDPDTYGCGIYVLFDESEYNDLASEYPDEEELDDYIVDDLLTQEGYKAFSAELDSEGRVHLYVGLFDEEDYLDYGDEGKIYNSVEEFVNEFVLV